MTTFPGYKSLRLALIERIARCYAPVSTGHFTQGSDMGNQLSGIAPSQILSVEHYFSDLSDFEFDGR